MPLVIADGTTSITINHVEFDSQSNEFFCHEDRTDDPIFSYTLPFTLTELPTSAFTEKIYLFKNDLLSGRRIFKLKLKEKPGDNKLVGYVFPLAAINDTPDIFENIHLKKIAFNTIQKLLQEQDLSLIANRPSYRTDSAYSLSDFYDQDLIVIAICDQFVSFPNYSFTDYLPALYKFGFRLSPNFNFQPLSSDCNVIQNNFNSLQAAITIDVPKNKLHLNYFINSLVKNELFLKDNEVARFHLYYQVIEMLLEKVYKNEVKIEVISNFNDLSSFDVKEILRETMKETYSLDKLIGTKYSKIDADILDELNQHISNFLGYVGVSYTVTEISRKIYKVRNILFHGYSKILENSTLNRIRISDELKKLNDAFEYLLIDLITSYKTT